MMTTLRTHIRGKLAVLCLLLANAVALGVFVSTRPAAAIGLDVCDESEEEACDCFGAGLPWWNPGCYGVAGDTHHCEDGSECLDDCEGAGPNCRKPDVH